MKSVLVLGRQPAIGLAELESLFGADNLASLNSTVAACELSPESIDFRRLGGSIKLGRYVATVNTSKLSEAYQELENLTLRLSSSIPEGKLQLGISAYGVKTSSKQLLATGLNLKKALRAKGRTVRLIPNQESALSSAQVLHNNLTGDRGLELLLIQSGRNIVVAQTTEVQDINAYARRDQKRPKRDAFVGMLPPKLAQIIINLAVGQTTPSTNQVVLDPFCGTGVVLQEAALMGFGTYGSDINPRMVEYSSVNLQWLSEQPEFPANTQSGPVRSTFTLEVGDATNHKWLPPPQFVACEGYLGQPLAHWPRPDKLEQIIGTCNLIFEKFLRNIGSQLAPGTRMCVAVPAWKTPEGKILHLPALDHLEKMRYNRVRFKYSREEDLVYYRSDQIVARELLVITRK